MTSQPVKRGRKPAAWDEKDIKQFKGLCHIQATEQDICHVMGVTDKTLVGLINRYLYEDITGKKKTKKAEPLLFSDAYKKYSAGGLMSLRRQMFKQMEKGNTAITIFLAKNMLGMKDNPDLNIAPESRPIVVFEFEPDD
jgi:hypothetical protein